MGPGGPEVALSLPGGMEKPSAAAAVRAADGRGHQQPGDLHTASGFRAAHPKSKPKATQTPLNPFFLGGGASRKKTPPPPCAGSTVPTQPFARGLRGGIRTWNPRGDPFVTGTDSPSGMSPAIPFPPPGEKISRFVFSRGVMTPAGAFPARGLKIAPRVWLPPVPAPPPRPLVHLFGQNIPIRGGEAPGKRGDFPETLSFAFLCSAGGEIVPGKKFSASTMLALKSFLGCSSAFTPSGRTGMCFEGSPPFISPAGAVSSVPLAQCLCHIWSLWPHGFNCFWGVKWLGGELKLVATSVHVGLCLIKSMYLEAVETGRPSCPWGWAGPLSSGGDPGVHLGPYLDFSFPVPLWWLCWILGPL